MTAGSASSEGSDLGRHWPGEVLGNRWALTLGRADTRGVLARSRRATFLPPVSGRPPVRSEPGASTRLMSPPALQSAVA